MVILLTLFCIVMALLLILHGTKIDELEKIIKQENELIESRLFYQEECDKELDEYLQNIVDMLNAMKK